MFYHCKWFWNVRAPILYCSIFCSMLFRQEFGKNCYEQRSIWQALSCVAQVAGSNWFAPYTVQKKIDFPRYNMKCSGEKRDTTQNISCTVVSFFPLHFMLYGGNLDYSSDSVIFFLIGDHVQTISVLPVRKLILIALQYMIYLYIYSTQILAWKILNYLL